MGKPLEDVWDADGWEPQLQCCLQHRDAALQQKVHHVPAEDAHGRPNVPHQTPSVTPKGHPQLQGHGAVGGRGGASAAPLCSSCLPPPPTPVLRAGACRAQTRCLQHATTLISEMGSAGKRFPPLHQVARRQGAFPGFTSKGGGGVEALRAPSQGLPASISIPGIAGQLQLLPL